MSHPERRTRRLFCLLVLASSVLCALPAAPALAARGHEFAGAFPGGFAGPAGIAVNETTGDVYVVDKGNNRVEVFNAAGTKLEGEFNGSGSNVLVEGKPAGSGGLPGEVPTGRFDEPEGIAVDNDPASPSFGDVYVVDTKGHILGSSSEEERMMIDKFTAGGRYIGQIATNPDHEQFEGKDFSELGFQKLFGVAVDSGGEVWVEEKNFGFSPRGAANYTNEVANKWIGFRSSENQESAEAAPGFAVDSEDDLYVRNTFGSGDRLAKFSEDGTLITPEVDEEAPRPNGVAVEAKSDSVYIAHAESVHRVSPTGSSLETLKAPGTPSFGGVAVNASSFTVYVADTAANKVDVFAPEAAGHPTVQAGSESVSDVTASSASFSAEVNPRSEPFEKATFYRFEYGPCETASTCSSSPFPQSTPVPEGSLAANYEPDMIGAHPQDLVPHTAYHVRVAAHNSHPPEVFGEELVFTTQGSSGPVLPDAREWELVSPADKHGAIIWPLVGSGVIQAAANGDAFSFLADTPTETEPAGFSQAVQILSRRGGASWESQDIATPHEVPVGISLAPGKGEYRFFSENLSRAVVQPFGPFTQSISPQASERTAYLRTNYPSGDPSHPCGSDCFRPLVTGCPGAGESCPGPVQEAANVPDGTNFGNACPGGYCEPYFLGASPDASHIVLGAGVALTEGAPAGGGLYEWSAGRLSLVSVLPGGLPALPGTTPALGFAAEIGTIKISRQAISSDGSRVVWSAGVLDSSKKPTGVRHLYLREMTGEGTTIQLDVPEAACTNKGKCKGPANPIFQTASVDDSRIFFTDTQPLTQTSGGSDLYECKIEEEEEELSCKLSDLTSPGAGKEGGGVLGLLAGASEDGSAIYFTANGKLTTEASARGENAVAGDCKGDTTVGTLESETAPQQCNLYVRSAGRTKLVAVLSGADFPDWSLRGSLGLQGLSDRVSPDGRYLAFMSRRSLSGYNNRDVLSGKLDQEVFLYDNATNTLICASCDPTGGRPRGVSYAKIDTVQTGLSGGPEIWPAGAWIAADVPSWAAVANGEGFALHQPRYLNDSGRLFFNSFDALVPQDSNRTVDVYEYEPPSVGDCATASTTFAATSGGCVALISSGTAKEESAFLDASETGDDVFFLTGQRLLPTQDLDSSMDVYDAHACGAISPCLPAPPQPGPPCEGDACQSPIAPPNDRTPGSLNFKGPTNTSTTPTTTVKPKSAALLKGEKLKRALKACKTKHNKQKRHTCEAQAHKRYGVARKPTKSTPRGTK